MSAARENTLRASLLMVLAMGLFALEDMFVKRAAATLPAAQILLAVGGAGALMLGGIALARGLPVFGRDFRRPVVLLRNLADMVGSASFVLALTLMPLATLSAILQAVPLAATAGAALFLGERVGWRRWSAIVVGFGGVLLVLRPEGGVPDAGAALALLSVLGLSARDLATRRLAGHIANLEVATWGFAALAAAGALLLPFGPAPRWPDGAALADLACATLLGIAALFALTAAVRGGPVAAVAPFRYTRIAFALLIGVVVFGERPDALMLLGTGLIVGSGLYALAREARAARVGLAAPSPPGAARL